MAPSRSSQRGWSNQLCTRRTSVTREASLPFESKTMKVG